MHLAAFSVRSQKSKRFCGKCESRPGLDFTFGSKCHRSIRQFHARESFNFTTQLTKKTGERAGLSLLNWRLSGLMFPTYVHPQGVWCRGMESTVGTGETLGDLMLCFDVPPHIWQLGCAVFTVVFTVVQTVLPTLVLAWKILIEMKKLLSVADFIFLWHLMSYRPSGATKWYLMLLMISPHVSPVRTPWWTYLVTEVTLKLRASQMFNPHMLLHIVMLLAGVSTVETLPYCLPTLIASLHCLLSNLHILVI